MLVHFYRKAEMIYFAIVCFLVVLSLVNIVMYAMDIGGWITVTIETLKETLNILWNIALVLTVATMAVWFFIKKDDERTLKFSVPTLGLLAVLYMMVEFMPV